MNKSYLIAPIVLLAVFGFLYNGALKEMQTKADNQAAVLKVKLDAEKKHKEEVEARATKDAKDRQDKQDALDQAKEDKKKKDYEDALKTLRDETAKYATEADKLSKEAADLEIQISQARTEKEKLNRETFDLAKQVEQDKINRRNAELEIQRMIEVVGKKLNDNNVVIPPAPPLAPPATK